MTQHKYTDVPVDWKANEDDVGLRVGERPQPVVRLLPGRVPQGQLDLLSVKVQPEKWQEHFWTSFRTGY